MKRLLSLLLLIVLLPAAVSAQLNTDRTLLVGRSALYFDDYLLAIRYFNQVIEAKPHLAEPYFLRAIAKYNLEDYSGARADATKATELNPFLPDAWEVKGVTNQCIGNHAGAIDDYSRALELLPYNRQMLFNLALAQEAADRFEAADSTYSTLLEAYPHFDAGYLGRAQLNLHRGDTIAARADVDRAIALNSNSVGALSMRAALTGNDDPAAALADMERAVTLQPDRAYLRVNRAIARYNAHDLNGAIDDFDYVLTVDPLNYQALFNRAMLRAELHDNDRALADLDRVLELRPNDLRARYNRAAVLVDKGEYDRAMTDADAVVKAYPDMYAAHILRGHINSMAGNEAAARADFRKASQLAHSTTVRGDSDDKATAATDTDTADETINRFKALQRADDNQDATAQTFNTKGMRSRVQDRNPAVEMQPIYQLSYYTADNTSAATAYDKEIEELNAARVLPFVVFLTNSLPTMTRQAESDRHFESIQRLGTLINSGNARPIDRFARAMDYVTLKDYAPALEDLDAVIAAQPDFAPSYLMRAAVRYRIRESQRGNVIIDGDQDALNASGAMVLEQIMADLNRALELNPRMAAAHYNRGVMLMRLEAWADAIDAFSRAIEIDPTMAPAYFNRGFAHFSRGNRDAAVPDISRAGQLGLHAAYPLLKQMQ